MSIKNSCLSQIIGPAAAGSAGPVSTPLKLSAKNPRSLTFWLFFHQTSCVSSLTCPSPMRILMSSFVDSTQPCLVVVTIWNWTVCLSGAQTLQAAIIFCQRNWKLNKIAAKIKSQGKHAHLIPLREPSTLHYRVKLRQSLTSSFQVTTSFLLRPKLKVISQGHISQNI